jgi:hypothetical protein
VSRAARSAPAFLPVTVIGSSASISSAARAQAIRYAGGLDGAGNQVWRGADILSMSWNGVADACGQQRADRGPGQRPQRQGLRGVRFIGQQRLRVREL